MTRKISTGINSLESIKIWNKEIFCFFWGSIYSWMCSAWNRSSYNILYRLLAESWKWINTSRQVDAGSKNCYWPVAVQRPPAQCTALQWELGRLQPKRRQWRGNQKLIKDLKPGARKAWEVEDKGKKQKIANKKATAPGWRRMCRWELQMRFKGSRQLPGKSCVEVRSPSCGQWLKSRNSQQKNLGQLMVSDCWSGLSHSLLLLWKVAKAGLHISLTEGNLLAVTGRPGKRINWDASLRSECSWLWGQRGGSWRRRGLWLYQRAGWRSVKVLEKTIDMNCSWTVDFSGCRWWWTRTRWGSSWRSRYEIRSRRWWVGWSSWPYAGWRPRRGSVRGRQGTRRSWTWVRTLTGTAQSFWGLLHPLDCTELSPGWLVGGSRRLLWCRGWAWRRSGLHRIRFHLAGILRWFWLTRAGICFWLVWWSERFDWLLWCCWHRNWRRPRQRQHRAWRCSWPWDGRAWHSCHGLKTLVVDLACQHRLSPGSKRCVGGRDGGRGCWENARPHGALGLVV